MPAQEICDRRHFIGNHHGDSQNGGLQGYSPGCRNYQITGGYGIVGLSHHDFDRMIRQIQNSRVQGRSQRYYELDILPLLEDHFSGISHERKQPRDLTMPAAGDEP